MSEDALRFSGVDGATGRYLHPELPLSRLGEAVAPSGGAHSGELDLRRTKAERAFAVRRQERADDLAHAGWGLVVPRGVSCEVLEALAPLCSRRREQAGARYKRFEVEPGETKQQFLERQSVGPGPANPDKVPYYLLLVGAPDLIPYRFQYELDVQYAVGRVCFDTPEEYWCYAENVIRAEAEPQDARRSVRVFGPCHPDDEATLLSTQRLLEPLQRELAGEAAGWDVDAVLGPRATKRRLGELLWNFTAPALLFTAGHGVGFRPGDERRMSDQGALLCQGWPGPAVGDAPVHEDVRLAGGDVPAGTAVRARVVFAFACFGAGTPDQDDFAHRAAARSPAVADGRPFVARLPQRLLAQPEGGALAFIGHVDRAWSWSFTWPGADEQTEVFTSALLALLDGKRVGHAMEYFAARSAEISGELTGLLYRRDYEAERVDRRRLSGLWTANNDARSYVVVGDPAVRLTESLAPA